MKGTQRKPKLSEGYTAYMLSPAWQQKRERIIFRDGGQCKACGGRDDLEVHHLTYAHFGKERDSELLTLCKKCHKAAHKTIQKK